MILIEKSTISNVTTFVVSLLRTEKNNFYSNLDTKIVADCRVFWKSVKPLLSEQTTKHSKINFVEDDKIISHGDQIGKKFSEYLINIPILNMPSNGCKCPGSSKQEPFKNYLTNIRTIQVLN